MVYRKQDVSDEEHRERFQSCQRSPQQFVSLSYDICSPARIIPKTQEFEAPCLSALKEYDHFLSCIFT